MGEKKIVLTDRTIFPHWQTENLRFGDTDQLGHVNNAVYATFSESGRVNLLLENGEIMVPSGVDTVIARLELDFRVELHWPGKVEIGTTVLGLGRSSYRLGQGMFSGDKCVATAVNVIVLIDLATRRSTPLPDSFRAYLSKFAPR